MTTLNLVLTNEVNDILEEKQRQKEQAEAGGSDNDNDAQDDLEGTAEEAAEEEPEPKAQEGADDKGKAAGNDAQRESVDEAVPAPSRKTLKGTAELKLSPEEHKHRLHADLFGPDFKPDERFALALHAAAEDVRQKRNQ